MAAGYRRRLSVQVAVLVLFSVFAWPAVNAHSDLQLQIEALSAQLDNDPDNVDLLLRRGDLQRRHQEPELARADFKRVREIEPGNKTVDWFEGRLEVESGQPGAGLLYLDQFLAGNPEHPIALQNRAQAYLMLEQPLLAARDYAVIIQSSKNPSPSLYGARAMALVAAGEDHYPTAMDVVNDGLLRFPSEISLSAIGTDIALAMSDQGMASDLINKLPHPTRKLPQWRTREALLDCQAGDKARAAEWFTSAARVSPESAYTQNLLGEEWLSRLGSEPTPANCSAAALEILQSR